MHAGRKAAVRGSTTVSWQDVRSVDLESFVKTSGGNGLHIAAALMPAPGWDDVKASPRHRQCQREQSRPLRRHRDQIQAQGQDPHRLFAYGRGSTAVAPYSTRARSGAAISMPLDWVEQPCLQSGRLISRSPTHFRWPRWIQIRGRTSRGAAAPLTEGKRLRRVV